MNAKSTESCLITTSKVHSVHEVSRSDRSGVYRNADAIRQERFIEQAIKKQKKREARAASSDAQRASSCTPTVGHRRTTGNPYAAENTRLGISGGPGRQSTSPKNQPLSPLPPAGPHELSAGRLSRQDTGGKGAKKSLTNKGQRLTYVSDADAPALLRKAQQVLDKAEADAGLGSSADAKRRKGGALETIPSLKAVTDPFSGLGLHRKHNVHTAAGTKRAAGTRARTLDDLEAEIEQKREQRDKSRLQEVSMGSTFVTNDLHFLSMLAGDIPVPEHDNVSLETFPPEEPELICTPRSLEIICRRGLAPAGERATSARKE
jgi:hypothetical protein